MFIQDLYMPGAYGSGLQYLSGNSLFPNFHQLEQTLAA
jgi:hypothetical protein